MNDKLAVSMKLSSGDIEDHQLVVGNDTHSVKDLTSIGYDIQSEYANHAAILAYWGMLSEKLYDRYSRIVMRKERLQAELYIHYRRSMEDSGVKRVTEAMVNNAVILDEQFVEVGELMQDLNHQHQLIKTLCFALREKGQMLISLGATLRQEADMSTTKVKEMIK